ncbi:MAG: M12 family metallo-peptidase [Acidobacteriota bacterium]|nr:M12 family metallo-peptidase [Acidobacteriota bacterium]
MRQLAAIFLVTISVLGIAIPTQPSNLPAKGSGPNVQEIQRQLRHYDLVTLDAGSVADQVRRTGQLSVSTAERTFEISLAPNEIRATNYRAEEVTENGTIQRLEGVTALIYKGTVRGMDDAQARFTINGNVVEGLIITRTEKFFIEPASRYTFSASRNDYIVYKESDVIQNFIGECPINLSEEVRSEMRRFSSSPQVKSQEFAVATSDAVTPLREVEIATEADTLFVQALGSAQAANNEILSILNMVDGVYQSEIGLTFKVVFQRAWTTQDPYSPTTSATTLLPDIRAKYNGSFAPGSAPARDVVHMWTGRAMDAAGYAFGGGVNHGLNTQADGVVCRDAQFGASAAYGVSVRLISAVAKVVVPAHEIGHNFGASHPDQESSNPPGCSTTIMNSDASNSTLTFCQFSRDQITNYVNGSNGNVANDNCLAVVTPPASSVQLTASSYNVNEGATTLTVQVTRTGSSAAPASVNYQTIDDPAAVRCDVLNGTAYARCDYATTVGVLSFAAGDTLKTFSIPIINDSYAEGNETFSISLSNPTGAALGSSASATVTINDNEAVTGPNPIFTTPFFVRLHYLDFLSREPEVGEPWSNVLNNCSDVNNNPACDRLTVSAAFFGSQEFQLKGYFVYRFYKLAFNRQPAYGEITPDMSSVTGQTPADVYQKKGAFTNAFAQRTEFTNAYGSMSNAQYVAALMNRYSLAQITTPDPAAPDGATKVTLTTADLTNRLNAGALTRAQVLRAIADSDQVFSAEFNRGFVAMQYYGYLRRTPEEPGYTGWLNYLNANPADSRTMVNGFMNSTEYRLRFGP